MAGKRAVRLWVVEWLRDSRVCLRVFDRKDDALTLARQAPPEVQATVILWEL